MEAICRLSVLRRSQNRYGSPDYTVRAVLGALKRPKPLLIYDIIKKNPKGGRQMKTFHVGGMNPVRRYKTLDTALAQMKDDDTLELHKNVVFSGQVESNIIFNGNGHTLTVENGSIGLDCKDEIVINNLTVVSEPRANGIVLRKGGRLNKVTAKIKGPARVLYPAVMAKSGKVVMNNCDLMRFLSEPEAKVNASESVFRDYYGGVTHITTFENLNVFNGTAIFNNCHLDCCYLKGRAVLDSCHLGVFNRSCGDVSMLSCMIEPMVNNPSVSLAKEPKDGPLEKRNDATKYAFEQEAGNLTVTGYQSNIAEEFVGFHIVKGSAEFRNVDNKDSSGYHIVRRASLSFVDVDDSAYFDIIGGTLSKVRSNIRTSVKTETAMEKLQKLIGLEEVKSSLKSIFNTISRNQKAKNKDFDFSYHMIFAGDPGTGKTTVAKIVAQALFEIGAVPENKCTEVSVDRLIKGYVGQTAEHVRHVLDNALGGVLFIDEAYELAVKENQNSFNSEAISVLIRYMEEHRDSLVVIAAGYEKEMRDFLASNTGLTRRFQWVSFPDYTVNDMARIFESMRKSYKEDYEDENLKSLLPVLFDRLTGIYLHKQDSKGRVTNGGNGGLVRNVFQQVVIARNNRVAEKPKSTEQITKVDLTAGFRQEMEKAIRV